VKKSSVIAGIAASVIAVSLGACASSETKEYQTASPPPYTFTPSPEPTTDVETYDYQPSGNFELIRTVMELNGMPYKFYSDDEFVQSALDASKVACKQIKKVGFDAWLEDMALWLVAEGASPKEAKRFGQALNAGTNVLCPEVR
jgi:hypothetical protein